MVAPGGAAPRPGAVALLPWAAASIAVAVFFLAGPALAEAPPLPRVARLEYVLGPGAKSCSSEAVFRSSVSAQVDHAVFVGDAAARVRVLLSRRAKDGRHEGAVDLYDAGGKALVHQAIEAMDRCSDVMRAAAVVVAETLDPIQPPAPPAPPPPVVVAAEAAPPVVVAEASRWEGHAVLGSWLGLGIAPRPAAGLSAEVGIRWSSMVSLSGELRWDPPAGADAGGGAQLSTRRLLGAMVPCGHWSPRESWGLFGCGVVQIGTIWGVNESFPSGPAVSALSFTVGARIGVELRLTPITPHLGVRMMSDLLVTPSRGAIWIGDQPGWTTPRVSGGVGLGMVVFW